MCNKKRFCRSARVLATTNRCPQIVSAVALRNIRCSIDWTFYVSDVLDLLIQQLMVVVYQVNYRYVQVRSCLKTTVFTRAPTNFVGRVRVDVKNDLISTHNAH